MLRFGVVPETSPFGVMPLCSQVVFGLLPAMRGYAGVDSVASSTSVQLRLPLPPWPAWTNQSRPQGVSARSVAFLRSFSIEIEPSEHVVWLWKSPATYVPAARAAVVQFTMAVCVSAHEAAGSPSLTVTLTDAVPAVV